MALICVWFVLVLVGTGNYSCVVCRLTDDFDLGLYVDESVVSHSYVRGTGMGKSVYIRTGTWVHSKGRVSPSTIPHPNGFGGWSGRGREDWVREGHVPI